MYRKILHLDLDAFYCAVEEQHNPALKGIPFAVGGSPDKRGVVASCSYPARKFGVRSAMPMAKAKRLCPDLVIVRWHRTDYGAVSKQVMAILHQLTPLVEQLSIDEAFLDVSDLADEGDILALELQGRIHQELDLPCSLGVASNKLVAKIANNIGKASVKTDSYPNAITVVPPGEEAAFLAPLPTRELWGVGPKTAERLAQMGLHTIGDIARYPAADLEARFGKHGADLAQRSKGIDHRPIVTEHEIKSVSREITYVQDVNDAATLDETLREQSQEVAAYLRRKGLRGTTVKIKLRWTDFTTVTRQTTLDFFTDDEDEIYEAAAQLLAANRPPERYVRLLGVGISGFEDEEEAGPVTRQLSLWEQPAKPELQTALEHLEDRFGEGIVLRGGEFDEG